MLRKIVMVNDNDVTIRETKKKLFYRFIVGIPSKIVYILKIIKTKRINDKLEIIG